MPFRDVTTNAGYITMAYDMGLVSGTTADTFSPDRTATREQVAVILMRLYDKLHGEGPAQIAVASEPGDFTGLEAVAVPAGRLIVVGGKPTINATLRQEEADAILEAARQAGAGKLLHLTGGPTAFNSTAAKTAAVVAEAVASGGYDGVFLDVPGLSSKKSGAMTGLVKALDAALGDKLLYVAAEAPTREGKAYGGYEYEALAAAADRLVLRIAPHETLSNGFPTAPVDPLEEICYALGSLRGSVDGSKLTLMITTAPSAWSGSKKYSLTAEEYETLLADGKTEFHYSNRYACAYLTGTLGSSREVVVWYLDRQAAAARLQLARAFGVEQLCLSDWGTATGDLLAGLQ